MHDAEAAELLEPLPADARHESWHLVRVDGTLIGHGTGGVHLLRSMRLTRRLGAVVDAVPHGVLERAYGLVARHRSLLGRLVPDGTAPRRFP